MWLVNLGYCFVVLSLLRRSVSLPTACNARLCVALAAATALVAWSPDWLTGVRRIRLLGWFEWAIPLLYAAVGFGALVWAARKHSRLARIVRIAIILLFLAFGSEWSGAGPHAVWLFTMWMAFRAARPIRVPARLSTFAASSFVAGCAILAVWFHLAPERVGPALGAPALVLIGLAAWCVCGTLLFVSLPARWNMPPLTPLALLLPILWSPFNDNHGLRVLPGAPDDERPAADADFLKWYDRNAQGDPAFPVFLVAASGGGLRAAYWTATVLAALDDQTCSDFRRHV